MSNNNGMTFWDWVSQNRSLFLFFLLLGFGLIGLALYNNFIVKTPWGSIERGSNQPIIPENNIENKAERIKSIQTIETKKSLLPNESRIHEPTKIEKQKPQKYISKVEDGTGKGVADVEVYCPNCVEKSVKTDSNGGFILDSYFDESATFWQSNLTLLKDKKVKTIIIYWRENSPEPINF